MTPKPNSSTTNGSRELGKLIMQLKRLERQPHTFGQAGTLSPSEIHTIDAIGIDSPVLMSELATRLGVTKGAITQIIQRLEGKSLVARAVHPEDARSTLLSLTSLGEEAYKTHLAVNHQFYDRLRSQLTQQEIAAFEKSLVILNDMLEP
ncbi:MarR family winged helix-turn-helix transcriptional regulator [Paenibacillus daejeonensis]|uniref:MarR family winged helix-turn-helix transcriptional regulator n=1 Tax=Paenibacillus daejeonensis TaxID=135193 RepID=UPI00037128A7|nr:MarR family transcriptional regulator [Paenibacillus daejeonensis]